jgi:thiol-disulfide isomerase/thioredoxin
VSDPVRRTIERLEGPVTPEPGFADELFVRLLEEAGGRRGPLRRTSGVIRRVPEGMRRALVAVAALGLVAAVFLLTLPLLLPSDPQALGGYGEMPPFRGVVEFTVSPDLLVGIDSDELTSGTHRIEVVYAGSDAWRFELLDDGLGSILPPVAGSFGAWDGERFQIYDAGQRAFGEQAIGATAFTILNPLAWTAQGDGWEELCRDPEVVGSEMLVGREATAVECGGRSAGIRLWLDEQTGLVLRAEAASDAESMSFEGPIGPGPGGGFRFVELEFGAAITRADAAFDPPSDAVPFEEVVTPPTTLTIGEPVPALPGLEAAGLDVTPSNGRPTAIYAWATWCPPCTGEPLDAYDEEAIGLARELNAFAVAFLDEPAATELFDAEGYRVTLVHDVEGELGAWGVEGIPTLLLLDGDGRLLGAYAGDLDGNDVRAILQAVVNGEPLPDVGGNAAQQIA